MTFTTNGKVSLTTDCNGMSGGYTVDGTSLQVGPNLAATMMACEGSQEGEFAGLITQTLTMVQSAEDTLILSLPQDGGKLTFTARE
jgi:heat shock protein HslJ